MLAEILEDEVNPIAEMVAHATRNADSAAFRQAFKASPDIDAVPEDIAILHHDVADVDANPETHRQLRVCSVRRFHCLLYRDRAGNRVEHAGEFGQHTVAGVLAMRPRCPTMRSSIVARRAESTAIVLSSSQCIRRL